MCFHDVSINRYFKCMTSVTTHNRVRGFQDLAMCVNDLWTALTEIPLTLKDAAVLLRAHRFHVGFEAAAVLAFKVKSQVKKKQLTVTKIVQAIASDDHTTFNRVTGICFFVNYRGHRFRHHTKAINISQLISRLMSSKVFGIHQTICILHFDNLLYIIIYHLCSVVYVA